jgi:iron complex outermembrane receptor protein
METILDSFLKSFSRKYFFSLNAVLTGLLLSLNTFKFYAQNQDSIPPNIEEERLRRLEQMLIDLDEAVISASRISESILRSPLSIDQIKAAEAKKLGAMSTFDALEFMKGVQIITPSLGFRVVNTRGFSNTTNVRFAQLVDGLDNQAPHIGAPIANALGASDLDIDKIEILPGTASALYGMNSTNGLLNIRTKNPFVHTGLSVQQISGLNHLGNVSSQSPSLYSVTHIRHARKFSEKFAGKINLSYVKGQDWEADNRKDLASKLNSSVGLFGEDNPAKDEVNSYGNESPNRQTLTLNGLKYVVARTGYREVDFADYSLENMKGDIGLYFRPKSGHELAVGYKGSLLNSIYNRANRFRLEDYNLNQFSLDYQAPTWQLRSYLTTENTGNSYNMRSLAENMDKAFTSNTTWFANYKTAFESATAQNISVSDAHDIARTSADNGRFIPGTEAWNVVADSLKNVNNWDIGAALRVRARLMHVEGIINWSNFNPDAFDKIGLQILSGFDSRDYIILPDGNYFINPETPNDLNNDLVYGKVGGFTQVSKSLFNEKVRLTATLRADKADYFETKFNPRFTAVYSPKETLNFRAAFQSGYRFPSIFEGFSNINSGNVKRVGGLPVMSNGIFENSYTRASIDAFTNKVNSDVNTLGISQEEAIASNKNLLVKNPYTYIKPEFIKSVEGGVRALAFKKRLYIDFDGYYNSYDNFMAQIEANVAKTTSSDPDSIATYFYNRKQNRYRLWTNSTSKIYNYGFALGLNYRVNEHLLLIGNATYSKLDRIDDRDGLEDAFNTPLWMINGTASFEDVWRNLGFGVTYRYQTQYDYVSFLVSDVVPQFRTIDAQVNYHFDRIGMTAKLGATNLTNKGYYSILANPLIGGMYYVSLTWSMPE